MKENEEMIEEVHRLLLDYFKNPVRVELRLNTPNAGLGNSTPKGLIDAGRVHKVLLLLLRGLEGY